MDVERLVSFKTFEKKMKDGSTVINCQVEPKYIEDILTIHKGIENFKRHQKEPSFEKFKEAIITELQKQHLEMVLNQDFKPIYVNVAPTALVHNVKIDTEVKLK